MTIRRAHNHLKLWKHRIAYSDSSFSALTLSLRIN